MAVFTRGGHFFHTDEKICRVEAISWRDVLLSSIGDNGVVFYNWYSGLEYDTLDKVEVGEVYEFSLIEDKVHSVTTIREKSSIYEFAAIFDSKIVSGIQKNTNSSSYSRLVPHRVETIGVNGATVSLIVDGKIESQYYLCVRKTRELLQVGEIYLFSFATFVPKQAKGIHYAYTISQTTANLYKEEFKKLF
ncbi:hypothetical protein [Mangrovibacterium marinum]|uniref:hypothetical protein n=1 Tax=Mangrovibacterium marinum TaxID=1639118 RepID=UPI002A1892BC|nr:hypothetical protein [Mangrovibacterium marinum]